MFEGTVVQGAVNPTVAFSKDDGLFVNLLWQNIKNSFFLMSFDRNMYIIQLTQPCPPSKPCC